MAFTAAEETHLKAKAAFEIKQKEYRAAVDSREAQIKTANANHVAAIKAIDDATLSNIETLKAEMNNLRKAVE